MAGRILEAYRPDLVQQALVAGKSHHSVRAKICQCVEDQQVQILERACNDAGRTVDIIYDAVSVVLR